MNNFIKRTINLFLLIFLIYTSTLPLCACIIDEPLSSDVELDLSSSTCEPPNIRKSNLQLEIPDDSDLDLAGLINLNISGSGQFSKPGIKTIKEYIGGNYTIIDIDLRQEPHGFINEDPVNWPKEKIPNDYTLTQITEIENNKLYAIPLNNPITYANVACKTIIPKSVEPESKFAEDNLFKYVRFPVTDGEIPVESIVNDFINFANNRPENSWFHFHCKEGIGRTTTFMIMYDIMKNKNLVSLQDIIDRQIILCNMDKDEINSFLTQERLDFFKDFYNRDFN